MPRGMRDTNLWFFAAIVALIGGIIGLAFAGNAVSGGAMLLFACVFFVMGLQSQKAGPNA